MEGRKGREEDKRKGQDRGGRIREGKKEDKREKISDGGRDGRKKRKVGTRKGR